MFDNLFMFAGSYYVELIKRKSIRKKSHRYFSLTFFRCRQTKPQLKILFAMFVFPGTNWEKPGPVSGTKDLTVKFVSYSLYFWTNWSGYSKGPTIEVHMKIFTSVIHY